MLMPEHMHAAAAHRVGAMARLAEQRRHSQRGTARAGQDPVALARWAPVARALRALLLTSMAAVLQRTGASLYRAGAGLSRRAVVRHGAAPRPTSGS